MIFDLVKDFTDVLVVMPQEHPRYRILKLLDEAIRRDVHFIDRHPTTLFQCLWNSCWWYDSPENEHHFVSMNEDPQTRRLPWRCLGEKLFTLMESWRVEKGAVTPGFRWVRSLRPPKTNLGSGIVRVFQTPAGIQSAILASDSHRLITGCVDGTIVVWDSDTGEPLRNFGPANLPSKTTRRRMRSFDDMRVNGICCSSDGKLIVSGGNDGTVCLWDALTCEQIRGLNRPYQFPVFSVCFSPDNSIIAFGHSGGVMLWFANESDSPIDFGHQAEVRKVDFSADGRMLVSASWDETVRVWDVSSRRELALLSHSDLVHSVTFAPNNSQVAAGGDDGIVRLWDRQNGKELFAIRTADGKAVSCVSFSPQGDRIVFGTWGGLIQICDVTRRQMYCDWKGHDGIVDSIAFSSDGQNVVSTSGHMTVIWDVSGPPQVCEVVNHASEVTAKVFSLDGRYLATQSEDSIRLWETTHGRCLAVVPSSRWTNKTLRFSNDSKILLCWRHGDSELRLHNTESGRQMAILSGHQNDIEDAFFVSMSEHRVVSSSHDGEVRLWDLTNNKTQAVLIQSGSAEGKRETTQVSMSTTLPRLMTRASGTHLLWDAMSGRLVSELAGINPKFKKDGQWIVDCLPEAVKIFDPITGKQRAEYVSKKKSKPILFGEHHILWMGAESKIQDIANGNVIPIALTSADKINDCQGSTLLISSSDYSLHAWNLNNGSRLSTFRDIRFRSRKGGHIVPNQVILAEKGRQAVGLYSSDTVAECGIAVWDTRTGLLLERLDGLGDFERVAGEVWRAISSPFIETVLFPPRVSTPAAWVSIFFHFLSTAPTGMTWAASLRMKNHLQMFHLVNESYC